MANVCLLFDTLVQRYPAMSDHFAPNAGIVHSPTFENAIAKVANGMQPTPAETKSAKSSAIQAPATGSKRKNCDDDDFATAILRQGSAPRRSDRSTTLCSPLAARVPPTSNICERLFSQCKLVLTPQRGRLRPANFEMITFLRSNMDMWNLSMLADSPNEISEQ